MVAAARAAGRVLDVAFNHRQRGDIQALQAGDRRGPARADLLREGVVAAAHRHPAAGQLVHQPRAGGRRAAAGHRHPRARLRAVPARAAGGDDRQRLHLRPARHGRVRLEPAHVQDGDGSGALRRRGPRVGVPAADDGGTLLVESSWAAHRQSGDEFGITLFGTEGGADLRVVDMEAIGTLKLFTDEAGVAAETLLRPPAGTGHDAVVERFLEQVRNGGASRRRGGRGARPRRRRVLPLGARAARDHVRLIVWTPRSGVHRSITSCLLVDAAPIEASVTSSRKAWLGPFAPGLAVELLHVVLVDDLVRGPGDLGLAGPVVVGVEGAAVDARSAGRAAGPWPSAPATSTRCTARRRGSSSRCRRCAASRPCAASPSSCACGRRRAPCTRAASSGAAVSKSDQEAMAVQLADVGAPRPARCRTRSTWRPSA